MSEADHGWLRASEAYQDRLLRAADIADRAQILATSPMFSFWEDIRKTLEQSADEIRMLRRQLEAMQDDAA